jgi:hypothetical protein
MTSSRKTVFNNEWLAYQNWSSWLVRCLDNLHAARCKVCLKTFALSNMGKQAVISHEKSSGHIRNVKEVTNTDTLSIPLLSGASTSHQTVTETKVSGKSESTAPKPSASASVQSLAMDVQVVHAEILWCLKMVQHHLSMRSAEGVGDLFAHMFPDSRVVEKFTLGRTKASYVINYGLAPYFTKQLKDTLTTCGPFVVLFDESLNQVVQRGQMDVVVRYFDDKTSSCRTQYLTSTFLGRARAEDLLLKFTQALRGLPQANIVQISMDGPSVNWSFLQKYEEHRAMEDIDQKLVELGSCGLHVVNGAFQTGHNATEWEINRLLRALYRLFKDVPARRAQYIEATGKSVFPSKFCAIRWTQNVSVGKRALEVF